MNKTQQAKLGMMDNILALCAANAGVVAFVIAFSKGVTKLQDIVKAIKKAAQIQAGQSTGGKNKAVAKEDLAEITLTVANGVSAYGSSIGDGDLVKSMEFTLSKLEKTRDENLPNVAETVKGVALSLLADLGDYGITTQTVDDLDKAITNFEIANTDPATIKAEKEVATKNIKQGFADADTLFDTILDKLVKQLAAKDAEFVKKYLELRRIGKVGTRHTAVSGGIFNETTGEPIFDAVFVIVGGDSAKSDIKGHYSVPHDEGMVKCKVEKEGFITKGIDNVVLEKGKITKLDVKLKPE